MISKQQARDSYQTTILAELPGICDACGEEYAAFADHLQANVDSAHMGVAIKELEHQRQMSWWLTGVAAGVITARGDQPESQVLVSDLNGSQVYFVQCGDYVKIGRSTNPVNRVEQLKRDTTLAPGEVDLASIELLATEPGGATREGLLHTRFGHLRSAGEWFRLAPELSDYIESVRI